MQKEIEAKYLARHRDEELALALSSPIASVAEAHAALAKEYRARLEALSARETDQNPGGS